jgi:hypothetical protein
MNGILDQLARTGILLDDLAKPILAGDTPPLEEIVMALVIGAMDADAVTVGDPQSTWNEKRLARMTLAGAFLAAMAVVGKTVDVFIRNGEVQRCGGR